MRSVITAVVLTSLIAGSYQYTYSINNGYGGSSYVSVVRGRGGGRAVAGFPTARLTTSGFRGARLTTTGFGGGDIIAQTRTLANSVKATLQQLSENPRSATIINRIINDKDNICLGSLEEGLDGIETATQLVEAAGDDIKALIAKVEAFQTLSEPSAVVREVANILRILGPLANNIAPKNPIICQATPDQSFGSLRSLAVLLDELYYNPPLPLSPAGRGQLRESANTISAVTTFLGQLGDNFAKFQEVCTPDRQYNIEAISAVGDLMVNLADMFGALGGVQTGQNIRKGKAFVARIVAELNKIDDLGVGDLDCNTPGDFTVAAKTLDDVATLIDDIGLVSLQQQLGVDFSFFVGTNP